MFFFYYNRREPSRTRRIDPPEIIRRLMPFSLPDKSGFLADDGGSLLVQCIHWNTARSKLEPVPFDHAPSGVIAASWARLDNRDELGRKLDMDEAETNGCSDTEMILRSYLKWQESCIDRLIGDFVFVIYDRQRRKVFCGRDHMGVRPFYYFASDDVFVCATSLNALLHLDCVPVSIDEQWVAEYLLNLSMSFDRTPYTGVRKLPPAHCLTVTPREMQLRRYFELSAEPALRLADPREYVDAYREELERAVKCRLDSDYAVGSELSGGVDSSTITAYAARFIDDPRSRLHTFAFVFSELEPQYIMAVNRACRLPNNHVFTERETEPLSLIQRSLELLGYPMEHGNATFHEPFYRLAEQLEIRTLFSGFGGDEFCTTIHGYMVPLEMLVQRRFRELFNVLPGNPLFRFLRMIKMELRRLKTDNFTVPEYNPRFYDAYRMRWPHRIVRDNLVSRYNLEERYFDEARFDAGYRDLKRFTLERRWQPFVPTRMENCTLMAAGRKIEYRWPLLDIRLVRLFLSIPSEENYYRGMGRYLHRRAIDGVVPEMVAWKPGKDMGAVMGQGMRGMDHLLQFPVPDLHPALAAYINTESLEHQIEQLPALMAAAPEDGKRFQYYKNVQAVLYLNTWMNYIEHDEA